MTAVKKSRDLILGIDLGTTNSLVAVYDSNGPRIFSDGESTLIPSTIVFDETGRIQAVGQRARTLKLLDPKRVAYSIKRLMGKGSRDLSTIGLDLPFDFSSSSEEMIRLKVGDKVYTPIELSAEILKRCKFVAENHLGHPVKRAVITVPAYFNDAQRSATAMAGKLAGLQVMRIINEPTAAALAFGIGKESEPQVVAVYDFGGGTFDISILKVTNGIFEVLSTDGDTHLGGDDFDRAIADLLLQRIKDAPSSKEDQVQFQAQCENIKKKLSEELEVDATIHWAQKIRWSGRISRDEIDQVIRPIIQRSLDRCRAAIKASGQEITDIHEVVMVGGSTRYPLVRSMVQNLFNRDPNTSVNPDEVVALGAAIQGSILAGEIDHTLLLDVVPLSLGIETIGGVVSKFIPRNSTLPCATSELYTTYADNQTGVDIHIVQGERELVSDCRSLGRFRLRIPPQPAGIPKIRVTFLMDANGILQVRATDERTKEAATLDVKPTFGLTDQEVEAMLKAAWENAEQDFAARQLVEAKNQAAALIRAVEKSLESPLIDRAYRAQQEQKISPVLRALKEDLKSSMTDVILTRTKELDLITQELAQTLLNLSVQSRLMNEPVESVRI